MKSSGSQILILFLLFIAISCNKENEILQLNNIAFPNTTSLQMQSYNPCESSKFRFDYDRLFFQAYFQHQSNINNYLNSCDTLLYKDKSMLFAINDIYRNTISAIEINFFDSKDLFLDFQVDPRASYAYKAVLQQLLNVIEHSNNFDKYLQNLHSLSDSIDLASLNKEDKVKISTLLFIVECESYNCFCEPEIRRWVKGWQRGPTMKEIKCGVSIIGGGILGGLGGAWIGAAAGAAVGWATGPCD